MPRGRRARAMAARWPAVVIGAGALMAVSLPLPWWTVDCDDGCSDGRTGYATAHLPADARVVLVYVLAAIAVALALAALASGDVARPRRWATVSLVLAAALVVTLLALPPGYENDPPIINRLVGWWLGVAGAALALAAGALSRAPLPRPPNRLGA